MNAKQVKRARKIIKASNPDMPNTRYIKKPFTKHFMVQNPGAEEPSIVKIQMNQIFLHDHCVKAQLNKVKQHYYNLTHQRKQKRVK